MKRLIGAALALSLLGATAASAAPAHGALQQVDYRDHSYRHRDNGNGAAVVAGIGFLALAAILASQNNHDHDGWYRQDNGWRDRDYGYRDYGYRDYGYRNDGYRDYDRGYGGYGYSQPYGSYRGW
ncbi:MAG TPA: hypothetical protein VN723_05685 [Rhizomicrobium sp.]|jgi:hypothetical protein|nr:hypothetical protein [Rhizomicrobium sp.]